MEIAIVTGASRGIGRAVALTLARRGARVVVNCRRERERAEAVAGEIRAAGGEAAVVVADVSEPAGASAVIEAAISTFGGLHVLVNNAGQTDEALLMRIQPDAWNHMLQVNLTSAFLCTRAAIRPMLRQRYGRIVNVSSVVGVSGNAGQAHYAAAKGGLLAFTKSVAREVAERSITCNAVAPGFIETDMTAPMRDEWRGRALAQIPMGRAGQVQEVAEAVAFLTSEAASYITGQVLAIDGGLVM